MSKYKPGDKFIIEIEKVLNKDESLGQLYLVEREGEQGRIYSEYVLDGYEKCNNLITKEEGERLYQAGLETGNETGMNEAWEIARRIAIPACEGGLDAYAWKEIFRKSSASMIFLEEQNVFEVKAKIEEWEREQEEKNKIQIGDVVKDEHGEILITNIGKERIHGIIINSEIHEKGSTFAAKPDRKLVKTGKHIDLSKLFTFTGDRNE